MKKLLIGVCVGAVVGGVPALAVAPKPDPHRCGELVTLVSVQYDRAFQADQLLYQGKVTKAHVKLAKIDSTWERFDQLARTCAR